MSSLNVERLLQTIDKSNKLLGNKSEELKKQLQKAKKIKKPIV